MKALIIIDVQNDFLPGGSLQVAGGDKIIPVINKVQEKFDLVVATQDWHPSDHQSFASVHAGKQPFEEIDLHGLKQTLWPDHCIQGSTGADFSSSLEMNQVETIFRKGMESEIDSYSGFYDNGHRKSTGLSDYLKGRGIKQVYLAGLAGDICVYFTGIDSLNVGFTTYIIKDATQPLDIDGFEKLLIDFEERGGRSLKSTEF